MGKAVLQYCRIQHAMRMINIALHEEQTRAFAAGQQARKAASHISRPLCEGATPRTPHLRVRVCETAHKYSSLFRKHTSLSRYSSFLPSFSTEAAPLCARLWAGSAPSAPAWVSLSSSSFSRAAVTPHETAMAPTSVKRKLGPLRPWSPLCDIGSVRGKQKSEPSKTRLLG